MLIHIDSIIIPTAFLQSKPRQQKVEKHREYYNTHAKLMKDVIVDFNYEMVDGYIDYLIAIENNMEFIDCLIINAEYSSKYYSRKNRKMIMDVLMCKSNNRCSICVCHLHTSHYADIKYYATIDHIIPLSKGGKDHIDNMQATCNRCNSIKGDSLPIYFRYNDKDFSFEEVQTNA
jgi:hypothetical protein